MRVDIITLFPEYFAVPLATSILGRATASNRVIFGCHDLRASADDAHGTVDDTPYGGGPGMVLKVNVVKAALDRVIAQGEGEAKPFVVLLTPQGRQLNQAVSLELSQQSWLIVICGHYEGFDERIRRYVDGEISIGPYVLSGGEPAALVLADSVVRLLPGVTGHPASTLEESYTLADDRGRLLLEYPQYTRPEEFDGQSVPAVLLSGHHGEIARWRLEQAKKRTLAADG